jgi:MYXO-CTERM domain-containing protein
MPRYLPFATALALVATPALAGPIEVTFSGTVATTPTDTITIVNPNDGTATTYSGANRPTYPVQAGDPFTVTFSASSRTYRAFRRPRTASTASRSLGGAALSGNGPNVAHITAIDVGGIGRAAGGEGEFFGVGGLTLVYDSKSGQSSIEIASTGAWGFDRISLPTYSYDPVADLFTPRDTCGVDRCNRNFAFGRETTLTFQPIDLFGPDGAAIGRLAPLVIENGRFSTGSVDVDEPAALPLFAGALAVTGFALARRRRRRRQAPKTSS